MIQFLLGHQGPIPLAAIWLGGSYGRGEGAVWRESAQERPCFDYDLYLIYTRSEAGQDLVPQLTRLAAGLKTQLTIPVQLRSPGDVHSLHALEPRLSWYDLCQSHQVIWGQADLVPQLRGGTVLPAETALQLLLLRGSQLLALLNDPSGGGEDPLTSWYRVVAALGDALLISLDSYHVSCQERARRFHVWQREQPYAWSRELGYLYQEALQYRLLPSEFEQMRGQLPSRIPALAQLFVDVYLAIFAREISRKPLSLQNFETLFLEQSRLAAKPQPATWQLRHLLANLRQYRGRNFHASWYLRPLLHRLYFLLPFLLSGELPSQANLARVLPDLAAEASLADAQTHFQGLLAQVQEGLV